MSSVVLMRAMVWCSPQLGHCETSSKRRRQYTQRKRPGSCVGRSQGSPQPGQAARRRTLSPSSASLIATIIAPQAADEETRGAIAVGADLPVLGAAEEILVLTAGDRAGRVDQRAARPQRLAGTIEQLRLHLDQAVDRRRRLAPARVGPGGERAEVRAWRVEQDPVEAGQAGPGGVGLDHGDAAQPEALRLARHFGGALGLVLDRDHLATIAHPGGDLAGLDAGPGAEVEDVLVRLRVEDLDHGGRAAALRSQLSGGD